MCEQYANLIFVDNDEKTNEERDLTTYGYFSNHIYFEYFVGYEIATLLGYKNPNEIIKTSVSKCNQLLFQEYPGVKQPMLKPRTILITRDGACEILLKTRKLITPDVAHLLNKFNIEITNKKCLTKEQQSLSELADIFKIHNSVFQYPVDSYKLDLYFPDYRLIVECDEDASYHRNEAKEQERMDYINIKLKTTDENWIRFKPDDKDFKLSNLIKAVNTFFHTHLPNQYRVCCVCKINKPFDDFNKNRRQALGIEYRCKVCRSNKYVKDAKKRKEVVIPNEKMCKECKETKQASEFYTGGCQPLSTMCKICVNKKRKELVKREKNTPNLFQCTKCKKINFLKYF